jgi:hypothetical protein
LFVGFNKYSTHVVKIMKIFKLRKFLHSPLAITVSGLAKVAIYTTNVDAENKTLINHKCVCGVLNRHFCQTRVSGSALS